MSSRATALRLDIESKLAHRIPSALSVRSRPQAELTLTGIPQLDGAIGGIERGALSEICGPDSSGRTTLLLSLLAQVTRTGETCALIDTTDNLQPRSAAAAGVALENLLWIRCRAESEKAAKQTDYALVEQAIRATDLILQNGGFGIVALDLAGIAPQAARRLPLASWFRLKRYIQETRTALVLLTREPVAHTCAGLCLSLRATEHACSGSDQQGVHLFGGLRFQAEVTRHRSGTPATDFGRKPPRSVPAISAPTAWTR